MGPRRSPGWPPTPDVDIVVSAIVGSAGLRSTWAALEAGKTVALANKESLVVGGPLITELARRKNATILPVDSEHSAVFQALAGRAAGGGAEGNTHRQRGAISHVLRRTTRQSDRRPTPWPTRTWAMGPKITVDSATLMNKALEIIEARWLFDLRADQIAVVIHPQSIVHSMVEYKDGSVIAQLGPPDMKLPIQYALTWPERREGVAAKLDWSRAMELRFEPPDFERFGALRLGLEVAAAGGTAGAVLNGANEAAVAAFLDGRIRLPPRSCPPAGASWKITTSIPIPAWSKCSRPTVGHARRYCVAVVRIIGYTVVTARRWPSAWAS